MLANRRVERHTRLIAYAEGHTRRHVHKHVCPSAQECSIRADGKRAERENLCSLRSEFALRVCVQHGPWGCVLCLA